LGYPFVKLGMLTVKRYKTSVL